jgi:hypothetical protein
LEKEDFFFYKKKLFIKIEQVPRTACGQCVKRFINGYIVTTDNEEAPSRILIIIKNNKKVININRYIYKRTHIVVQAHWETKTHTYSNSTAAERLNLHIVVLLRTQLLACG